MRSTMIVIVLCSWSSLLAQQNSVTLNEAIQEALKNNKRMQVATLDIEYQRQFRRSAIDIGKTNVMYMRGQYNSYEKNDNNITVTQSLPFPTVLTSQKALGKSLVRGSELQKVATDNELVYQVKQVYYQLVYFAAKEVLLMYQDSIYRNFVKAADVRFKAGETHLLEKTTAETQQLEAYNAVAQTHADVLIYQQLLSTLMNRTQPVTIDRTEVSERSMTLAFDSASISQNPQLAFLEHQVTASSYERKVANAKFFPDIQLGYFNQTLIGSPLNSNGEVATKSDRFQGFQVGLSVPLFFGSQAGKVKAATINQQKAQVQFDYAKMQMRGEWQQAVQEYYKNKSSVTYYQTSALKNVELILRQSDLAFSNGEIDYLEYLIAVRNALQIRENYLNSLNNLNQSVINLEFLAGTK